MTEQTIAVLNKHRQLGWVFALYAVVRPGAADFLESQHVILAQNVEDSPHLYTDAEKALVRIIAQYDERMLVKLFSKKQQTSKDFMDSISAEMLEKFIRPYIEKKLAQCVDLLIKSEIPLYFKHEKSNIYPQDKIQICRSQPQTVFNFTRHNEGLDYFLSIKINDKETRLLDKKHILLSIEPCCIIIEDLLFNFADIDGNKLQPFFSKKSISIPQRIEQKYFESFVLNAVIKYEVHATGFEIIDIIEKPHYQLCVSNNLLQKPAFIPQFVYRSKTFRINNSEPVLVSMVNTDNQYIYFKYYRDLNAEASFLQKCKSLGLVEQHTSFLNVESPDEGYEHISLLNWIEANRDFLVENQVEISDNNNLRYNLASGSISKFEYDLNADWFDISIVVEFGTFKIPFIRIYKYIKDRRREFQLPNGEIAIIPQAWFSQFGDLANLVVETDGEVKLKSRYIGVLDYNNTTDKPIQILGSLRQFIQEGGSAQTPPDSLQATLRPYQQLGFNWLHALHSFNLGGCLADDMGLGKTLQTISLLLATLPKREASNAPINKPAEPTLFDSIIAQVYESNDVAKEYPASLIVMPTSLLHNWYNELQRFAPQLKVIIYYGLQRNKEISYFNNYDIILTTYGTLRTDASIFASYQFYYVILDESQVIKNIQSKTYESIISLMAKHRLALSGTPIENHLGDLWAQFNFAVPGLLGSYSEFVKEYLHPINDGNTAVADRLKRLIKPLVLRREKRSVLTELPDLMEQVLYCPMTEAQEYFYEGEKSKVRNELLDEQADKDIPMPKVIAMLTRLRQIAIHPALIEDSTVMESGKFMQVLYNLESLIDEGHKVLLFSTFVSYLKLFAQEFDKRQWQYSMLTGDTKNRAEVIENFQNNQNNNLFLISIKAGGVGLNLTAADYVFILDPWWNPAIEEQAISRAHRMGQKNKVFVYRFISERTLEEKILLLQEKKKELFQQFIDNEINFKLTNETLQVLLD